jgi:hypothetical protein
VNGTQILCGTRSTNQFVIFTLDETAPADPQTVTAKVITVTAAASGAFGLGIGFGNGDTVWGKGGGTPLSYCSYDYAAGTGAVIGTYAAPAGIPTTTTAIGVDPDHQCIAGIDVNNSDNVRLYSYFANTPKPDFYFLDQEFLATDNINGNSIGSVSIGAGKVYALDVNNGIVCYTTTKPVVPSIGPISTNQTTHEYEFILNGSIGTTYVVETSTDLAANTWTALQTITPVAVETLIHTPNTTPRQFFRARIGP